MSFKDADARWLAGGRRVGRLVVLERVALRKLRQLQIAGSLQDLRVPPGNLLEKLRGDREGQWSIRVDDPYRICFIWTDAGPAEAEIVDYH